MRHVVIAFALALEAAVIYFPVHGFDFVNYDDDVYMGARRIDEGLTARNVEWAFSTFHHSNWHPLTWLSWLTEIEVFGVRPGPMHLGNALLHAANGVLLYMALLSLTRKAVPSALAAALFAAHPMHVESVAWISERKDVLSVFFGLLAIIAYARYAEHTRPLTYIATIAAFALSLLAKPMLVTLPLVLLLLDFWPTERYTTYRWSRLALEKAPLFAMSAASCVVTWMAQSAGGAIKTVETFPLWLRLSTASVGYLNYVAKTFAPVNLAAFYPHPSDGLNFTAAVLAAGVVAIVSLNAWVYRERSGYVFTGWFWFVGALAPVIGIVQVGEQAIADRYSYWPHIGLFVALTFGIYAIAIENRSSVAQNCTYTVCAACIVTLGVLASIQTRVWKDSETLWRHVLAVTENNYVAHANLGHALLATDPDEAEREFEAALAIRPDHFESLIDIANIWLERGETEQAIAAYLEAAERFPGAYLAYANFGGALEKAGRRGEAIEAYKNALNRAPADIETRVRLADALLADGNFEHAVVQFEYAIQLDPSNARPRIGAARSLAALGKTSEARAQLERALRDEPDNAEASKLLQEVLVPGK